MTEMKGNARARMRTGHPAGPEHHAHHGAVGGSSPTRLAALRSLTSLMHTRKMGHMNENETHRSGMNVGHDPENSRPGERCSLETRTCKDPTPCAASYWHTCKVGFPRSMP